MLNFFYIFSLIKYYFFYVFMWLLIPADASKNRHMFQFCDKPKEMVNKSSFLNKTIDVKLDDKNISLHEIRPLETLAVYAYYFN